MEIVHIIKDEKFFYDYINFINNNFSSDKHKFIYISNKEKAKYKIPKCDNIIDFGCSVETISGLLLNWWRIKAIIYKADKVILHGAACSNFNKFLFFNKSFLAKTYWVMWGGDLYQPIINPPKTIKQKIHSFFDNKVKGNVFGYVGFIYGDYLLAKDLYNTNGLFYECLAYPSNIVAETENKNKNKNKNNFNILIGNSADPSNDHLFILEQISKIDNMNMSVICPLSYGDLDYAKGVESLGMDLFSSRFISIKEFLSLDDYLELIDNIDVVVFNHKRQQGCGNTISLLAKGKKVYLNKTTTTYKFFKSLGVDIFDSEQIDSTFFLEFDGAKNREIILKYCSIKNLVSQWDNIFKMSDKYGIK
ncbi:TDP-N-acetylfucosamine:lipid II N-acetylfucosaminyltransferase [Photobacterium leiognathi]|uniref:TDP-N-acetylfucosamine:lipid II N-acetylfucosaminyltransferase n=1 Tax=Photobacterium leiognathi TaxID=553611 RepID=UPI002981729F|nr:TDP-N-acetylfucosamine:lipid II N-acetylfucosaminyltransferase [Photobacterium leiognathi]